MSKKSSEVSGKIFTEEESLSRERLFEICDSLEKLWGMGKEKHVFLADPLDGLIQTILSQNTNDKNRDRAYTELKKQFPFWENVLLAPEEDLEKAISVAGLSKVKSRYIREVLEFVEKTFGELSLKSLKDVPCENVREFLEGMPGVGPKTAACVLLFQFGCPAFPVDTHVTRVSKRLGIAKEKDDTRKIEKKFRAFLPEHRFLEVHLNCIVHGRNLCLSRKPRCPECPLEHLCVFVKKSNA